MATKPYAAAFVAKLLAALPEGEEPVANKAFLRQIASDLQAEWNRRMAEVEQAKQDREIAWHAYKAGEHTPQNAVLYGIYCEMLEGVGPPLHRQMLIPAPSHREMRWKRKLLGRGPAREVEQEKLAFARDEKRLGPIPAPKRVLKRDGVKEGR